MDGLEGLTVECLFVNARNLNARQLASLSGLLCQNRQDRFALLESLSHSHST